MSTQLTTTLLTPEEYLAVEREAEFKSEYIDGAVYAMTGAKYWHTQITGNIIIELGSQLRGRPGSVLPADMKVRVPDASKFFYPDVSVVCGKPQFHDQRTDVILNPVLIAEVLSKSTASFDRGEKFQAYQTIPSLREYVLVAQNKPVVEHFVRQTNDEWTYKAAIGRGSSLRLPSVECTLDLSAVHDKVNWEQNQ